MRIKEQKSSRFDAGWQTLEVEEKDGWILSEPATELHGKLYIDKSLPHAVKARLVSDWLSYKSGRRLELH